MSTLEEVATEIRILKCMSKISGYVEFIDAGEVSGNVPPYFVKARKEWEEKPLVGQDQPSAEVFDSQSKFWA